MKKLVLILSMPLMASLCPAYGKEPFFCLPELSDETVVYCNDFNSPNSLVETTAYADVYNYQNTTYSGSGSAIYTSQRTVEIIGLNLTPGASDNTNGVYQDINDSSNKYTLGLVTSLNAQALSQGSDIMGFVFDVKDPQGNIYDHIQIEFDVAPAFLTYGSDNKSGTFSYENINYPIWESTDAPMVTVALFDGKKTLSIITPVDLSSSSFLDSDVLIGSPPLLYVKSGPIQNYPVNFTTVETSLSTKGLVDPDGKVTLMFSLDNSSINFPVSKSRYGLIDNLKVTTTNRANPGGDVSSVPSLTLVPLLILITLFGLLVPYRLRRRS